MTEINRVSDNIYEIPATGGMRVPGRIFADAKLLESIRTDNAPEQVMNVAHLPGIVKYSMAMPDVHWGYGFPIGGVAAFDMDEGIISPGGVGYDINCGVRALRTSIPIAEIERVKHRLLSECFSRVPCGVGSADSIRTPSRSEFEQVLKKGAVWAADKGFEKGGDTACCEEQGALDGADPAAVSKHALQRGINQLGTLGSGNHFMEIDEIVEIFDEEAAAAFGLVKGMAAIQIHTGSRGFGHQVCDDALKFLMHATRAYKIDLPDRQLVCAPLGSPEAEKYFGGMACAANFAWANRQIIAHLVVEVFEQVFGEKASKLGMGLVYDVCHNIAKFETHTVDGAARRLCVHRKGATRAFPPGAAELPDRYRSIGQPVLIPGDMGSSSYICRGTAKAEEMTFASSCHGAGRLLSRTAAIKKGQNRNIFNELKADGIELISKSRKTAAEEMPEAYKNSTTVVNVMHNLGIATKVARLEPKGVIKG